MFLGLPVTSNIVFYTIDWPFPFRVLLAIPVLAFYPTQSNPSFPFSAFLLKFYNLKHLCKNSSNKYYTL